jgi:glycosyltransferase involved in cell wall biosynthesis
MSGASGRLLTPVFSALERWAVGRASKVNLVSQGFARYFQTRYPRQRFSFFTNGIDDEFLTATADTSSTHVRTNGTPTRPLEILYAGNVGEGQGLHTIIPALADRMKGRATFVVIGDGGRRAALERALEQSGVTNVELRSPVNREELLKAYQHADILFLHLNDYEAFKKVLPSKLFEYAAMGKPIWAGVAGYAAEFTTGEIENSAVFEPCDAAGALRAFETLTLEDISRGAFIAKYARKNISHRIATDIVSVAAEQR